MRELKDAVARQLRHAGRRIPPVNLLSVKIQPHLGIGQRPLVIAPPDRRLAKAAMRLEHQLADQRVLQTPHHRQALGEIVAVAAKNQIHRQIAPSGIVQGLHRGVHRIGHVVNARAEPLEHAQFRPAGGHEYRVGHLRPMLDPLHVARHEKRIVVAMRHHAARPAGLDLEQGLVADHVAVPRDHQIRLHRVHRFQQTTVRPPHAQSAHAERRLERRHVAITEGHRVVIVFNQAEGQLLCPAHTRLPVSAKLLISDVKDSHEKGARDARERIKWRAPGARQGLVSVTGRGPGRINDASGTRPSI